MERLPRRNSHGWLIALCMIMVPLQGSLLNLSVAGDLRPDMALVAVYLCGLKLDKLRASLCGFLAGLMADVLAGGMLGIQAFSKMLSGWVAATGKKRFYINTALVHWVLLFALSIIDGLVDALFLAYFYSDYPLSATLPRVVLPQAFYTALTGSLLIVASEPATRAAGTLKNAIAQRFSHASSRL